MCGITGISWDDKEVIKGMMKVVAHRGPDQEGVYHDAHVTLGHRRLSIIDLSEKGREPMSNEDGTLWLIFNGEIYNYKSLKGDLLKKGYRFRSNTDCEVILHAYEEYKEQCFSLLEGIFAFALWDTREKALILVRDPIGIKPLYYWYHEGKLAFGSEIKAILACHEVSREVNREALGSFLKYRFVITDDTFFQGIKKLLPGHYLKMKQGKISLAQFWDITAYHGTSSFLELFEKSVKEQLMSDVPLGVFLSGGLDSSSVVGVMQQFVEGNIKTFTAGFNDSRDEFKYARVVSDYFKTDHHEVYIDYEDMTKIFPKLVWHLDEPIADPAIVPTYFLAKLAKKKVTVALVGEGSDELFAGYQPYRLLENGNFAIPKSLKIKAFSSAATSFHNYEIKKLMNYQEKDKISQFIQGKNDTLKQAQLFDFKIVMPNFQLMKVDKMTMANSLEARVPYLSTYLTNFAFSLPTKMKMHKNRGKYIVRESLKGILPKEITKGTKRVFYTPLKKWFAHGLEDYAQTVLSRENVHESGLFNYQGVERLFRLQRTSLRKFKYPYQLWMILMVQVWHDTFFKR